jgi:hypothetical protein
LFVIAEASPGFAISLSSSSLAVVYREPKRDLILLVIESVPKTTSIELPPELMMLGGLIEVSLPRREQSFYSFDVRHSGFLSFWQYQAIGD